MATIITDSQLNVLAEAGGLPCIKSDALLAGMDE
jgi:oligoribonuclease (3'-5' exoribonuclease)